MWLVGLTDLWIAEIRFLNLSPRPDIKSSTQQKESKKKLELPRPRGLDSGTELPEGFEAVSQEPPK